MRAGRPGSAQHAARQPAMRAGRPDRPKTPHLSPPSEARWAARPPGRRAGGRPPPRPRPTWSITARELRGDDTSAGSHGTSEAVASPAVPEDPRHELGRLGEALAI